MSLAPTYIIRRVVIVHGLVVEHVPSRMVAAAVDTLFGVQVLNEATFRVVVVEPFDKPGAVGNDLEAEMPRLVVSVSFFQVCQY